MMAEPTPAPKKTIEERVYALENGQVTLVEMMACVLESTRSLNGAVFALGLWMQTQSEGLTGEPCPKPPLAN